MKCLNSDNLPLPPFSILPEKSLLGVRFAAGSYCLPADFLTDFSLVFLCGSPDCDDLVLLGFGVKLRNILHPKRWATILPVLYSYGQGDPGAEFASREGLLPGGAGRICHRSYGVYY